MAMLFDRPRRVVRSCPSVVIESRIRSVANGVWPATKALRSE
jgi:hypothetical protein